MGISLNKALLPGGGWHWGVPLDSHGPMISFLLKAAKDESQVFTSFARDDNAEVDGCACTVGPRCLS